MTSRPADRRIRTTAELDTLRFDPASGLLPVVAQDAGTGAVLMLAWANRDALECTLESGEMWYWSRSRGELWRKGATSGNTQALRELRADCDGDALLALVDPAGPACHTGDRTCFDGSVPVPPVGRHAWLDDLRSVLEARARERPEGSYTTRLLDDENLRLKKLGEEAAELVHALAKDEGERAVEEAADLLFHLVVALLAAGRTLDDVGAVLERRRR